MRIVRYSTKKESLKDMKLQGTIVLLLLTLALHAQQFELYQGDTINRLDEQKRKQGQWIVFNSDQTKILEEGLYLNGRKDGIWKKYYQNGNLQSEITYQKGRPNGFARIYYSNGNVSEEGLWRGDKWVGEYIFYYQNGNPAYVWHYNEKGEREGEQKYFHENGEVKLQGQWKAGKKDGLVKEFRENGSLKKKMVYEAGKKSRQEEFDAPVNTVVEQTTSQEIVATVPQVDPKEKQEEIGVFRNSGYNELYNQQKQITHKGEFKNGRLISGERYYYDKKGDLARVEIYENGRVIQIKAK